jgi:endonuclease/exonuclease/phosphatase family metal-dependent hydrolase
MSYPTGRHRIRCLSFNVMGDLRPHAGFERWDARRAGCMETIKRAHADLIAVQECLLAQQDDIAAMLPGFERSASDLSGADAAMRSEFRAKIGIEMPATGELLTLFRRDAFECLERRECWLSPTPMRVSTGFGSRAPRSLLALRLRHRASARELWLANTRLDHNCAAAMAGVAVRMLAEWIGAAPALWPGDFNAGFGSAAAQVISDAGWRAPQMPTHTYRGERTEHIWRRGPALDLGACEVIDSMASEPALSDHDPLIGEFELDAEVPRA